MQMTAKKFTRIKRDLKDVTVVSVSSRDNTVTIGWDRTDGQVVVESYSYTVRLHTNGRCRSQHDTAYWIKQLETLV